MRKGVSLLSLFLFLISSPVLGDETGLTRRGSQINFNKGFKAEVGTGYGAFNGVVVPSETSAVESQRLTSQHEGMPISILGGWYGNFGQIQSSVDISYLKMINMKYQSTEREAAAGYSRFELTLSGDYWLNPYIAGSLLLVNRRNFYKSRLESHVLDGVMPGGGIRTRFGRWHSSLTGYKSIYSNYGYNKGRSASNRSLGQTQSSVQGFEWENAYSTSPDGHIAVGIQQEKAEVQINDINEYKSYGFNISPSLPRQRSYQLSTTIFTLGFLKHF